VRASCAHGLFNVLVGQQFLFFFERPERWNRIDVCWKIFLELGGGNGSLLGIYRRCNEYYRRTEAELRFRYLE